MASATASPELSSAAAAAEWTQVLAWGDGSGRDVGGLLAYGDAGFLATGARVEGGEGGPRIGARYLWHSVDGRDWESVGLPAAVEELWAEALTTAADGSYVLFGSRPVPGVVGAETVAFRSPDGMNWEEIVTGLPDTLYIQAIEHGPAGYLLVGGQGGETNPSLWMSDDGLSWEQVHEFLQTDAFIQLHDADAGEQGFVVLGRRIDPETSAYQRFSFASSDGRNWIGRDEPFGSDNQAFVFEANVSSLGPDWVATVGHPDGLTGTWFSADGIEWSEIGSLDAEGNTSAGVLTELRDGMIFSPSGGLSFEGIPGVWSSSDGADWTLVDLGSDAWLGGVAEGSGVTAMLGTIPGEDFTSTVGIWITEVPG